MPTSAPMVTTPVPPIPVTRIPYGASSAGSSGSGSVPKRASSASLAAASGFSGLRNLPPSTVTKLGQKPFTQEKSLLQLDWSMARLRPNSVSTGITLRQLDCTEQSPQPSQTSSLMITRLAGSTILPRLRRRRFSAAQVWS